MVDSPDAPTGAPSTPQGKEPDTSPHMQANPQTAENIPPQAETPPPMREHPDTSTEQEQSIIEKFTTSLAKPSKDDFYDMLRWTQKTVVQDSVEEYQVRWMERAIPILSRVDDLPSKWREPIKLKMKRTIMSVAAADYLNAPRNRVFDSPGCVTQPAWVKWMHNPDIRSIFDAVYKVMEEEVLNHELQSIRRSVRTTRISAARAAEVRAELLDDPNPWVKLAAARDILQSADRATAAKRAIDEHITIEATLSEKQIDLLLSRAATELDSWADTDQSDTTRPVIILDNAPTTRPSDSHSNDEEE